MFAAIKDKHIHSVLILKRLSQLFKFLTNLRVSRKVKKEFVQLCLPIVNIYDIFLRLSLQSSKIHTYIGTYVHTCIHTYIHNDDNNNNNNNNDNNNNWNLYSAISIHKIFKSAAHCHSLSDSQQSPMGEPEKVCFETLLEGLTRCRILQLLWKRIS